MNYLLLAWRNIWRNKRRSLITMASVMFAVVLAIIMKSMITGVWGKMVDDVVSFSSGYIQIHKQGYWNEQSIDNAMHADPKLIELMAAEKEISDWTPRVETFSLASTAEKTKGVLIQGIHPERENRTTRLADKIISGSYLSMNDNAVMIAEGLANQLKLNLHDTLVLLGQGYHGSMAAGKYPIQAIVHLGVVELNRSMVWMPLTTCQSYLSADSLLTSISVMLKDKESMATVCERMRSHALAEGYEVLTWKEMLPELDQMVEGDSAAHFLVIWVLYAVISFGIFGTLLMLMNERKHEFGILLAIGMKKRIMSLITALEVLMMGLLGAVAGCLLALPLITYLHSHPIRFSGDLAKVYEGFGMEAVLPPSTQPQIFISQALTVSVIVLLLSLYPVYSIARLTIMKALNA
jgi:ABC-type lipoprotein release transport system permease subunit